MPVGVRPTEPPMSARGRALGRRTDRAAVVVLRIVVIALCSVLLVLATVEALVAMRLAVFGGTVTELDSSYSGHAAGLWNLGRDLLWQCPASSYCVGNSGS